MHPPEKIGFALEYSLGHITHSDNLKRFLAGHPEIDPLYVDIPYDGTPMPALLRPLLHDNWSVRASLAAKRGLAPHAQELSACLFHTQVTSLFSVGLMRRVPSIVSLDATPLQYDALGSFYKHNPGPAPLEALKKRMNERAYHAARHLVTWSEWAKASLRSDYGVAPEKVTVIPPGIDPSLWRVDRTGEQRPIKPTYLFVGGDFERKGGSTLLQAFRQVRAAVPEAQLIVATKPDSLPADFNEPGVELHRGLKPNSPELRALYARADIFAFPTLGDCLPLAVMEALAAGLPVISSDVGALSEAVTHDDCGLIVPPSNPAALAAAMLSLATDHAKLRAFSRQAEARATEKFDAAKNYGQLIGLLKQVAADSMGEKANPSLTPAQQSS